MTKTFNTTVAAALLATSVFGASAALAAPGDREARVARGWQFSVERAVDRYLSLLSATGPRVEDQLTSPSPQAEPAGP